MKPPMPVDEEARVQALEEYQVLDTEPEQEYDDLTFLASHICGTPMALMSLLDSDRQWFKSRVGITQNQTPRDVAFCAYAILHENLFVVQDAKEDPRFASSPLVTEDPGIRFYAGAPLITPTGHAVGTICVMDRQPRTLTAEQHRALEALGRQVVKQLELRKTILEQERMEEDLRAARAASDSANRIKTRYVASLSNELRTPLNAVVRLSAALLDDPHVQKNERSRQDALRIHSAGQQMQALLADMLGA
jgi:GAF domain-containing protein